MDKSVSSEFSKLRNYLDEHGCDFVTEIRASAFPPIDFVLFVTGDHVADRVRRGYTSSRQMERFRSAIHKDLNISVEWIVTPAHQASAIESALLEIMQIQFPGAVDAVFVSLPGVTPVWVWVEPNPKANKLPELKAVSAACTELFRLFDLQAPSVMFVNGPEFPSNPMILRCLKTFAPITSDRLAIKLREAGSLIPDDRWLQTKLDTMRRNRLVIRSAAGAYALTEFALSSVPHGKTRSSSDIQRALALGKRKW